MLEVILPVFLLILVGYVCRHYGVLLPDDASRLVDIIVYVTFPATLFLGLVQAPTPNEAWKLPLWSYVCIAALFGLTYLIARMMKLDHPTAGALISSSAFGNTAFLGVPITFAAFGAEGWVSALFYDLFGVSITLYTVGFLLLAHFGGQKPTLRNSLAFFRTPVFVAAVLAFSVRAWAPMWTETGPGSLLPSRIMIGSLERLSVMTAPLAMLALGVNLRFRAVVEFAPLVTVSILSKLLFMPLVAFVLVHWFGPAGIPGQTAVMEAAMPSGLVAGVVCGRFGCNARLGAAITVGTTLAAIITLPLWAGLVQ